MSVNENDFDSLYGSKYFSAADLHGETQRHKIGKVDLVELREKDGSTKKKFAAFFVGVDKALILNQTNAARLAAEYGKNPQKWVGTTSDVYSEPTTFAQGVRLKPLKAAPAPAPAGKNMPNDDLTDLPF